MFKCTSRCGASCNDSAALPDGCVDGCSRSRRKRVVLGVEADVFELFCADRLKGAETNMQGNGLNLDAVLFELSDNFWRKVQARSWGGSASGVLREPRLVTVAI